MATTTFYNWPTPDDTALVKDGAQAIRDLGSSIDSTTEDLNPATTEGDMQYASATAHVNERLAIGTAGQVLQVNSGADAPEWVTPAAGGGLTQIATGTLSGAIFNISSIPQTFKGLKLIVRNGLVSNNIEDIQLRINGQTTSYSLNFAFGIATNAFSSTFFANIIANAHNVDNENIAIVDIWDYANTTTFKFCQFYQINVFGSTPTSAFFSSGNGSSELIAAITELNFFATSGTMTAGTFFLYGVN